MRKAFFLLVLSLAFGTMGRSEDKSLDQYLSKVGSIYGKAYLQPFSNSFGANINSGWFHGANPGSNGFHFSLDIRGAGAMVPDADKFLTGVTYTDTVTIPAGYIGAGQREEVTFTATGPTVFGDDKMKGFATARGASGATYSDSTIQGLVSTSIVPFPIPQLTLGTIMGTDASIRFLPKIALGSFGSIQFWGVAVRHSVSQYLGDNSPVDVAVQVGFQGLTLADSTGADLVTNSAFLANVEVSKSFSILTLYGGLQTEKSSMDIKYHYNNSFTGGTTDIAFTMDGSNKFRAIIGANIGLGPLNLNADYNMGTVSVVSGGLGFSF